MYNRPSIAELQRLKRERKSTLDKAANLRGKGFTAGVDALLRKVEELTADIVNEERALKIADDREEFPATEGPRSTEYRDAQTGESLRVFRHGDQQRNYSGPTIGEISHAQLTGRGLQDLRAQGIDTGAAGGFTIPSDVSNQVVEMVANRSTVMRSGTPVVSMPRGQMRLAKIDAVTAGAWTDENAEIDAATVQFGAVEMVAKKCALIVKVSNELMNDSPNAVEALNRAIIDAVALAVDQGALSGTGVGSQPLGLLNWQDADTNPLPTTSLAGAVGKWSDLIAAHYQLLGENAGPATSTFLNPLNLGLLDTEVAAETGHFLMGRPAARDQMTIVPSNQLLVADHKSTLVMGDFARGMVIGMTSPMQAEWSGHPGFDRDQIWLRVTLRMDIGVIRPSFFKLLTNAATTT